MADLVAEFRTYVGPTVNGDGARPVVRSARDGSIVMQVSHAEYQEAVARGGVFSASNQAAQAISVALATTYTGLCVSNPIGSGKSMVLLAVGFALTVAPAAIASLHLIGGASATVNVTHTAAVVPENAALGRSEVPVGKADSQATIPTPTYKWSLASGFTAAALGQVTPPFESKGLFIVNPGGFLAIGALTAVTGFGCMAWEEVPLIA